MRSLVLAAVLGVAFAARAQSAEPPEPPRLSCKVVASQATQRLMGSALEGEPATDDEKRVFGEFQRGVVDECTRAGELSCFAPRPGEAKKATAHCGADPVGAWMATSASQIMTTQTKQNRATQALAVVLSKTPEPAPPAPARAAPEPTPPPAPRVAARPAVTARAAEDVPLIEGDMLFAVPLTNMSRRELRGIQTLLEEAKPGLGLSIGMYGGGAGGLAVGAFFIASSTGYYYVNTFGLVLGGIALTAGVVMILIGTIALVSRLRARTLYNLRLDEVRTLLRKPAKSAMLEPASTLVTLAEW